MNINAPVSGETEAALTQRFGTLAITMLNSPPLAEVWQVNFLANFFVGAVYREMAERFDVSRPEFVILYCLSQRPGLVARDVCLATGLPKNSISRAVAQLLDKGLIERMTDASDKRAKPLVMTGAGKESLAQVMPLMTERQASMRAALSPDEQAQFDHLLGKLIEAMPDWVGED
ncbi:MAG: MarR family winged helix-turn-helix transcriptional regulator [Phyllobacteriaceae bacterium]|jgi:DNA-binding MarR family transcriptional regulator|nr:MarR family winged helix-turn-helix transcriptional regulator [Phyllobacteriaceae bacterium]